MHVQQHVAVERPVTDGIGGQIETRLAARKDVDGVLARLMILGAVDQFEEVAVQVNRVRHHRVVDQGHAHAIIMAEGKRGRVFG